jgi:hypothetical protein
VLLTLTREDLEGVGVATLGDRATLMSKIDMAKKQHFAGQCQLAVLPPPTP